ncbi:peptidase M19 [Aquicoccus sp. SCR17]|nr:peptidase M19 [Carideicomes alvinocaridis]
MRWIRRLFVLIIVLAVVGLALIWTVVPGWIESGRNTVAEHDPYPVSEEAQALHDSIVVGDWHADSLLWQRDLLKRSERGQVDLPRLQEGGVALQVFTAVTKSPMGQNYDENSAEALDNITLLAFAQLWPIRTWDSLFERAMYQARKLQDFAERSDGAIRIVRSEDDLDAVLEARENGEEVLGALLGIEGSHPLEGNLANIDRLMEAGHRIFGLQHFFDNQLGGSLHGESNEGLSDFGRAVVRDLMDRPVIIDLAHSSPQVVEDVLDMTDFPLIVSHTGLHSHCATKRNLPDELLRRVADTGGVIGLGYWAEAACDDITPAGIAQMAVAAVEVLGDDHVSLGSDFDGSVGTAFDTSELPALTSAMLEAGLSEEQVTKIMGGNMVRVLRARLD